MQAKTEAMLSENERLKALLAEEERKKSELQAQLEIAKSKYSLALIANITFC